MMQVYIDYPCAKLLPKWSKIEESEGITAQHPGFLPGIIVMLVFLLFSDQILGGQQTLMVTTRFVSVDKKTRISEFKP